MTMRCFDTATLNGTLSHESSPHQGQSARALLHAFLNRDTTLLTQSEWTALDKQLKDNVVRKALPQSTRAL